MRVFSLTLAAVCLAMALLVRHVAYQMQDAGVYFVRPAPGLEAITPPVFMLILALVLVFCAMLFVLLAITPRVAR